MLLHVKWSNFLNIQFNFAKCLPMLGLTCKWPDKSTKNMRYRFTKISVAQGIGDHVKIDSAEILLYKLWRQGLFLNLKSSQIS